MIGATKFLELLIHPFVMGGCSPFGRYAQAAQPYAERGAKDAGQCHQAEGKYDEITHQAAPVLRSGAARRILAEGKD